MEVESLRKGCFMPRKLRLTAWCKVTKACAYLSRRHKYANRSHKYAVSKKGGKRASKVSVFARRRANRRCPPSQKSLIGMRSFSRGYTANTYGTSTMQSKGCICERRYNCPDEDRGKSAMGFLNEGMGNSTFYAGGDSCHHRHISLCTNRVPRTSAHPNR